MQIIDCVQIELYTYDFWGTKLKTNYIWGYVNKELQYHCSRGYHCFCLHDIRVGKIDGAVLLKHLHNMTSAG
jgi:hypothetical protein